MYNNPLGEIVQEVYSQALNPEVLGWKPKIYISWHQVIQMQRAHRLWETLVFKWWEKVPQADHHKAILFTKLYDSIMFQVLKEPSEGAPIEMKLGMLEEYCCSWCLVLALWINEWIFEFRIRLKWLKSWVSMTLSKFLNFSEPEYSEHGSVYPRC